MIAVAFVDWLNKDTRFITQSHSLCVVPAATPFSDFYRRVGGGGGGGGGGGLIHAFSRKPTETKALKWCCHIGTAMSTQL